MTTLSIALIGNGEINDYSSLKSHLKRFPYIIAVDGGLNHCDNIGIEPNLIVGDLDSLSEEMLKKYSRVEIKKFPSEKNETDMELGVLEALKQKPSNITLFGALGNRTDHLLSNLYLARKYRHLISLVSDYEELFFINGLKKVITHPGQGVSLLPVGSTVTEVTTQGLKWELDKAVIDQTFMSQSNVALGDAFTVSCKGDLLCSLLLN